MTDKILFVMPHRADAKVDTYSSFTDLAAHEVRGRDYDLLVRHRNGTRVAVIAPHGGGIEPETARIAEAIAGAEFSLYCFKGLKRNGNGRLHITSHSFDEPDCLSLIAKHEWGLAIHGCADAGERVFLVQLSANRDEREFAQADRFDIHRDNSHRHVGFGYGIHFCLGAALARMEARAIFTRMLEVLPVMTAAEPDPRWVPTLISRTQSALPVRIDTPD